MACVQSPHCYLTYDDLAVVVPDGIPFIVVGGLDRPCSVDLSRGIATVEAGTLNELRVKMWHWANLTHRSLHLAELEDAKRVAFLVDKGDGSAVLWRDFMASIIVHEMTSSGFMGVLVTFNILAVHHTIKRVTEFNAKRQSPT